MEWNRRARGGRQRTRCTVHMLGLALRNFCSLCDTNLFQFHIFPSFRVWLIEFVVYFSRFSPLKIYSIRIQFMLNVSAIHVLFVDSWPNAKQVVFYSRTLKRIPFRENGKLKFKSNFPFPRFVWLWKCLPGLSGHSKANIEHGKNRRRTNSVDMYTAVKRQRNKSEILRNRSVHWTAAIKACDWFSRPLLLYRTTIIESN